MRRSLPASSALGRYVDTTARRACGSATPPAKAVSELAALRPYVVALKRDYNTLLLRLSAQESIVTRLRMARGAEPLAAAAPQSAVGGGSAPTHVFIGTKNFHTADAGGSGTVGVGGVGVFYGDGDARNFSLGVLTLAPNGNQCTLRLLAVAITEAVRRQPDGSTAVVHVASPHLVEMFACAPRWRSRGWVNSQGRPTVYAAMWDRYEAGRLAAASQRGVHAQLQVVPAGDNAHALLLAAAAQARCSGGDGAEDAVDDTADFKDAYSKLKAYRKLARVS